MNTKYIVAALLLLAIAGAGWFFASPLFIDEVVDEPLAAIGITKEDVDAMTPAQREKLMTDMMVEASGQTRRIDESMAAEMGESPLVVAVGQFRDGDAIHKGSGRVSLYRLADGSHAIRFEDFEVTNGPALVVLMAGATDPKNAKDVQTFNIKLGDLKGNIGNQNYLIPAEINVGRYRSVVIWCELFDVLFSSATLNVTLSRTGVVQKLQSHHPLMVLGDATEMDFREIASFNDGTIGIFRSGPGVSPWELHPDHDELLYVLDGAVTITVLGDVDETDILVEKGSLVVIPRGHWHRHTVQNLLVEMFVSPAETRHSMADDPRIDS